MSAFLLSALAAAVVGAVVAWRIRASVERGRKFRRGRLLAMVAGLVYGVLGRLLFGLSYAHWDVPIPDSVTSALGVMTGSFLFVLPVAIGYLDQSVADELSDAPYHWVLAFFVPMQSVLLMLGLMALLSIEGTICIAMASPAFLLLAGLGGLVGHAVRRHTNERTRTGLLSVALLMPYVACPIEQRFTVPEERREVENAVKIRAPPGIVWEEIASVPAISRSELPFRVAHLIGLPRPVEATLSEHRTGGVRIATFERGLSFRETVTRWEPARALSFSIHVEDAPSAALDEHVAVGGPFFDVLDGTYELEATPDGGTLLRLTSHQRLSTRFNFYARLWTDFVMSDLQSAIMSVVRERSERASAQRAGT
ncbi:MAG TPA: hypothetical protein VHE30_22265 [Polyangiaceae bacterium]|nr:hypothetical protein [Polyangiaceae bacterium]